MPRANENELVAERLSVDGVEADRRRGRGAVTNVSGRYEPIARVAEDDGWESLAELPAFKTTITNEKPRTGLAKLSTTVLT